MGEVIQLAPKRHTKAVYVRSLTAGYSGADSVYMQITLPRAPWERAEEGAPEGRVATGAQKRLETQRRR